jgi:endonuclease/exonuclease/phosphatase (EEP) superfamily protein YafD
MKSKRLIWPGCAVLSISATVSLLPAGGFNSEPNQAEVGRIMAAGRFAARLDAPFTISSYDPHAVIDHIFVPRDWQLLEHRVIRTDLSDHLPVVCTYRVPLAAGSRPHDHEENR